MTSNDYRQDDGATENALGFGNTGTSVFIHSFTRQAGLEVITGISASFGWNDPTGDSCLLGGEAIEVWVWKDANNDSDPSDAIQIGHGSAVIDVGSVQTDVMQKIPLDAPAPLGSGVFFIGLSVPDSPGCFPIPLDETTENGATAFVDFLASVTAAACTVDADCAATAGCTATAVCVDQGDDTLGCQEADDTTCGGTAQTFTGDISEAADLDAFDFDGVFLLTANAEATTAVCGANACETPVEDSCTCPGDCGSPLIAETGFCGDGQDNDCDGLFDCRDPDCLSACCGNGDLDVTAGEICDDANTAAGDGCGATCLLELCVPGPGPGPGNDCCQDATTISDGTHAFDTTASGTDGAAHPQSDCAGIGDPGDILQDVWFEYTSTCTGELTASTCGDASFDTRVALYENTAADCPLNAAVLNTCNDDFGICTGFTSIARTNTAVGTTYLIRLGGTNEGDAGAGNLTVECFPCDPVATPCPTPFEGEPDCAGGVDCLDGSGSTCYIDDTNAGCNADGWDAGANGGVHAYTTITYSMEAAETGCGTTGNYMMPSFSLECDDDNPCDVGTCGPTFPGACEQPQAVRDTDWYQIEIFDTGGNGCDQVTWTTTSNFPMQALIIASPDPTWGVGCGDALTFADAATAGSCRDATTTACLEPGVYVMHATYDGSVASNGNLPCGTPYEWSLLVEEEEFVDCNSNGIRDDIDIATCIGNSCCEDCDSDGIPNECQITLDGFVLSGCPDDTAIDGGAISCPGGVNTHARGFPAVSDITLGRVNVFMQTVDCPGGDLPVTVRIWEDATGLPPSVDTDGDDPLATTLFEAIVGVSEDGEVQVPISPPIVIGLTPVDLVVEISWPECAGENASWPGTNADCDETQTYIRAPGCGPDDYVLTVDANGGPFPGTGLLIELVEEIDDDNGIDEDGPDDIPGNEDDDAPHGVAGDCVPDTPCADIIDPCIDTNECGDDNSDSIRDEVCAFWDCAAGLCVDNGRGVPTDMGGAFGACPSDVFCNIHDRTHALTCFAGTNGCASINIDGSGAFGACPLDGFCNIHDANAALTCFAGTNSCVCGPTPEGPGGSNVVGQAGLKVVSNARSASPGELVELRVFLSDAVTRFQSYQLHLATGGGSAGQLILEDVFIEARKDHVFTGHESFNAMNVEKSQMLSGVDSAGITAPAGAYLATLIYRVSDNASGTFVVDIKSDESNQDQTFLISQHTNKVEISRTTPAVIRINSGKTRRTN
jgi:hypothetical protein